ncbi:hypothetical protein ROS9278_01745 [Roseomonas sp. CECT 9278]|nr:hypothetical protein [Roseomonas sp. CECT 9278]CAH0193496.1 hypothetical protein ROS9278_01745 [Roseomonas sp. CECT 9278]
MKDTTPKRRPSIAAAWKAASLIEDTVTVIWREVGKPTDVYPPCEILKVRKADGVTGVLYLAPSGYEGRSIPFGRFLTLAK